MSIHEALGQISDIKQSLNLVEDERRRQLDKWGPQNHDPALWLAILTEEVGEVAKEIAEGRIAPFDRGHYEEELVHVAAVAVAALESARRASV